MRSTKTVWFVALAIVGGVALGTGSRAVAQDGGQASRCVPATSHCDLTFEFGAIDAPQEPFSITGSCALIHLGRIQVRSEGVANFSGGTTSGTLSGTAVYVTENGDELRSNFTGTFEPDAVVSTTLLFANSGRFSGGTGRFERASGSATVTGFADLGTGVGGLGGDGTVCLNGTTR